MRARNFFVLAIFLGLSIRACAYVTSAVLEYCAGDGTGIYLNGSQVLERSEFGDSHYRVLSTSDGSLPLELFKDNQKNVLAFQVTKIELGGEMTLSYRLTVRFSDAKPMVLWSEPVDTKFIRLRKEDKNPLGWNELDFDDTTWMPAGGDETNSGDLDWQPLRDLMPKAGWGRATLAEKKFSDFFGNGCVPYLVMNGRTKDRILLRKEFNFKNQAAPPQLTIVPAQARQGQIVTVRLAPGADALEYSSFKLTAWLPKGMTMLDSASDGDWKASDRSITWKYSNSDMKADVLKLYAEKVVSADSWGAPQKALGAPKEGKDERQFNIPDSVFEDGAVIWSDGWFKLEEPDVNPKLGPPAIRGVLFKARIRLGGSDGSGTFEKDRIYFNYSVNGQEPKRVLKKDVDLARSANGTSWYDGYYDATDDRVWTWDDIKNLMVMFKAHAIGNPEENRMSSITCLVRYGYPERATPWFKARIVEDGCATLPLQGGMFRLGSQLTKTKPIGLRVNTDQCAPTPTPRSTPVPVRRATVQATATSSPTALPTPVPTKVAQISLGLGCLTIAPDLVDEKGAFISFCLKADCEVSVAIYNAESGRGKRRFLPANFKAGASNQVFFDGKDNHGNLLQPGRYLCELRANKNGHVETRNTYFKMALRKVTP